MPRVKVTRSRKVKGGRLIVGLYGPSMGFQPVDEVIRNIQQGSIRYFVREGSWEEDVRVVDDGGGFVLVTTKNVFSPNNLENLPDY